MWIDLSASAPRILCSQTIWSPSSRPCILDTLHEICKKAHTVTVNREYGKRSRMFVTVHLDVGMGAVFYADREYGFTGLKWRRCGILHTMRKAIAVFERKRSIRPTPAIVANIKLSVALQRRRAARATFASRTWDRHHHRGKDNAGNAIRHTDHTRHNTEATINFTDEFRNVSVTLMYPWRKWAWLAGRVVGVVDTRLG